MTTTSRRASVAALILAVGLGTAGCAVSVEEPQVATTPATSKPASAKPSPSQTPSSTPVAASVETVAGYAPGEFPPVPLFRLPDISLLDASMAGFAIDIAADITPRPGLDIRPAVCGTATERAAGQGTMSLYGDGSGNYVGPDGELWNYGDGSGSFDIGGATVSNYGDGSGSYENGDVVIWNYGDGSGSYVSGARTTWVYGDGSASFVDTAAGVDHWNYGDGSAAYTDGTVEIHNYGDGSGSYESGGLTIWNYGDGTGMVNGTPTTVEPIPAEQPVGVFPPLGALKPIEHCGTTITLDAGVLFDFDKSEVRPDASAVLDELAAAMDELGVPAAEIGGHTDAIGSDDYNQTLSEQRAASVVAALEERGVAASLDAVGYGETAPVAPNEIDGQDNPAGRQLNRRVEIFIPAF